MKLGDKVQFNKHYKKTGNYLDTSGDADENWTEEQKRTWEEEDYAVIERARVVEHPSKNGIIAGIRNMAITKTITLNPSYGPYNSIDTSNSLQKVYLVAVNMSGFYRVHPDWIEEAGVNGNL